MLRSNSFVTVCCHVCGKKSQYVAERFKRNNNNQYTFINDCFCGVEHIIKFTVTTDFVHGVNNIIDDSENCNLVDIPSLEFIAYD